MRIVLEASQGLKYLSRKLLAVSTIVLGISSVASSPAYAVCSNCAVYQQAIEQEFQTHMNWMTDEWWGDYVKPALKKMNDEVRNATLFEIAAFGSFLDAQNEVASQRAIEESIATTLKNYAVSDSLCRFGTLSRSLASSQARSRVNQIVLGERSQNRQVGQVNMASQGGEQEDRGARLAQFRTDFCDPTDFGTGMSALCGSTSDKRQNIDINFTRAVDTKKTLDVDFSNSTVTDDEKNIIALANNLYAHRVFDRVPTEGLGDDANVDLISAFLDQRSVVAKRSVAENSFNAIVGDKSVGATGSKTYLLQALQNLGLSSTDAAKYVGNNPSYDAQMEVLTKKIYQDPAFYANLMESPANVNRQYAAMQSFGLMQKRDIFETISRSEMLLSMILEMEVAKYQDDVQNRQNAN